MSAHVIMLFILHFVDVARSFYHDFVIQNLNQFQQTLTLSTLPQMERRRFVGDAKASAMVTEGAFINMCTTSLST